MDFRDFNICELLNLILTAQNDERKTAESILKQSRSHNLESYMRSLLESYKNCNFNEKKLIAVLINQAISNNSTESASLLSNPIFRNFIETSLFSLIFQETNTDLLKQISLCISNLFILLATQFQETDSILSTTFELLKGPNHLLEAGLLILGEIITFILPLDPNASDQLLVICENCLTNNDIALGISSVNFLSKYLNALHENEIVQVSDLLCKALKFISNCIENQSLDAMLAVESLRNLAEGNPISFKGSLCTVIETVEKIQIYEERHLKILNTLFNLIDCIIPELGEEMISNPIYFYKLVTSIFNFMNQESISVDSDWLDPESVHNEGDKIDDIEIQYSKLGASYISNLLKYLNEPHLLSNLISIIQVDFPSSIPSQTYSKLNVISEIIQNSDSLSQFDSLILFFPQLLEFPMPKVPSSVLSCINSFSAAFCEDFTDTFHNILMPSLLKLLNSPIPRLVSESLKAVNSFLSYSGHLLVNSYKLQIMSQVLLLTNHLSSCVQYENLNLINLIFTKFQLDLNSLKNEIFAALVKIVNNKRVLVRIRGKALETAANICAKVQDHTQVELSIELMRFIVSVKNELVEEDPAIRAFLLSAWHSLAEVLNLDIQEFIDEILPVISDVIVNYSSRCLQASSETNTISNDFDSQQVVNACEALLVICMNLKSRFYPYLEKCLNYFLPLIDSSHSSAIREASAKLMPCFVDIIKIQGNLGSNFIKIILHKLWEQVSDEYDKKLQSFFIFTIKSLLETYAEEIMTYQEIKVSVDNLISLLMNSYKELKSSCSLKPKSLIENFPEEISELNSSICELLMIFMKTHHTGCTFLMYSIVNKVFPTFLNSDEPDEYHKIAIFLIDDMIEHLKLEEITRYFGSFYKSLATHSLNPNPDVRQAALFGLGLLFQRTENSNFRFSSEEIKNLLMEAIFSEKFNNGKESIYARENAISTFVKFLKFQADIENFDAYFRIISELMPLRFDKEEAKTSNDIFCDICYDYLKVIVGNQTYIQKVILIFGVILDTELCEVRTARKAQVILKSLNQASHEIVQSLLLEIDNLQSKKIQVLLNEVIN